jgi:hypothetical protein
MLKAVPLKMERPLQRRIASAKPAGEMFSNIWNDGYSPGIMDFMGGAIKSNAPQLLQQLLVAFGK